jgi:hypothetical protein
VQVVVIVFILAVIFFGKAWNSIKFIEWSTGGRLYWNSRVDVLLIVKITANYNVGVRFQVLTAASMMFRVVFWDILPCKMIVTHPWWWRQYAPLKRRSTIILHGSRSQKTTPNHVDVLLVLLSLKGIFILLCCSFCLPSAWPISFLALV